MDFQTKPLSENFGAEILDVDLTHVDEDMAEAILSTVQKHALLLFRRQSLHDDDIYRLSRAHTNTSGAWETCSFTITPFLHKRDTYEGIRFLKATRLFLSPDRFASPTNQTTMPLA